MATLIRCGFLFDGKGETAQADRTIVVENGAIEWVGPSAQANSPKEGDAVIDHSGSFALPGLIDLHTHLAYGNAKSEENIDLYAPMEFRALRAMFFAQQVVAAGYTSICSPGDAGRISLSVRDAVRAGLFPGPRIMAAGPYLTSRQGLADWYPSWIGTPDTSVGRLIRSVDEGIEEARRQIKDGVDCIKIAMDGRMKRQDGEFMAAFNQQELDTMVTEIHRLGRKVIVHARGREATLYSARAKVDMIFHASYMDDECLEAILKNKCVICPTLTFLRHDIDFTQPTDQAYQEGRSDASEAEFTIACKALSRAYKAGVPILPGTDSGFALTPYGEWHAKELDIFVKHLGMTPAQALRSATSESAKFLCYGDEVGSLEPGRQADIVIVDGDPLRDISVLMERKRIRAVYKSGEAADLTPRKYNPRQVSDFSHQWWSDLYTRERVEQLFGQKQPGQLHAGQKVA
jgi:imidazolonepropionase-like amidohydrolase